MMAYGDIEMTAARDESWHHLVSEAVQRASWPGSSERVPIRRGGIRIAYVVGADYLEELERTAGLGHARMSFPAGQLPACTRNPATGTIDHAPGCSCPEVTRAARLPGVPEG